MIFIFVQREFKPRWSVIAVFMLFLLAKLIELIAAEVASENGVTAPGHGIYLINSATSMVSHGDSTANVHH